MDRRHKPGGWQALLPQPGHQRLSVGLSSAPTAPPRAATADDARGNDAAANASKPSGSAIAAGAADGTDAGQDAHADADRSGQYAASLRKDGPCGVQY